MAFIVIFMTTSSRNEAIEIVRHLLNEKLIACANIIASVRSLFWWQGSVEDMEETLVFMKTKSELFKEISKHIIKLHSYKTPEIIALPITYGSKPYLKWISSVVKSSEGFGIG